MPLNFADEEIDALFALATPLPPPMRDGFLRSLLIRSPLIRSTRDDPGSVYGVAMEVQRDLLKNEPIAVGPGDK